MLVPLTTCSIYPHLLRRDDCLPHLSSYLGIPKTASIGLVIKQVLQWAMARGMELVEGMLAWTRGLPLLQGLNPQ